MLELGPVPGDLLLLQAFYPFANNINVLLCTAVFTYECRQIASAEKDGVREYCSKRAGELSFGQASSIMLKPDVERCFLLVTWAPLVRHLHKCHLYSSQCGRESGNGGPAARSGKMKSAVGSKLPSTTSVCSLPALFLCKHEWDMQTSAVRGSLALSLCYLLIAFNLADMLCVYNA